MGADARDGDAVTSLLVRQLRTNPFGEHADANALGGEIARETAGIAFHAAHDRKEVGRQDQDARPHPASTVRRRSVQ